MSLLRPRPAHRRRRLLAGTAGIALLAAPLAGAGALTSAEAKGPGTAPGQQAIELDLLAINDFHGQIEKLDPALTSSGRVDTPTGSRVPAGGGEYLATHLDQLRERAAGRGAETLTVAAGDLIGATPLLSAAFHDEPTIETMNALGLDIASVGNHEFDEGYRELLRLQRGGCLDDGDGENNQDSCPDPSAPFTGADFQYLGANVTYADSGETVLPPYVIEKVGRAKVGFIGMTLEGTPDIVTAAGIEGLEFGDEVETVNALVPELRAQGVRSIVVLMHEGATTANARAYDGCPGVSGPAVQIAEQFDPAVDAVVSGHTHQPYNCTVTDPAGNERLLTSAYSVGRLVTDVSLRIDPRSKDVIRPESRATNHIVTNSDGTEPDAAVSEIIATYSELVAPIASKVLGQIAPAAAQNSLPRQFVNDDFELGNLIADSQRLDPSATPAGQDEPVIAFMNPGGIRADLVEDAAGSVTYGAAFSVQPFNNYVVSMDLTGAQVLDVLNEQWNGANATTTARKTLQVSGLSYAYDESEAAGSAADAVVGTPLVDLDRDGTAETPLDPSATYRVVVNSFLAGGGDGFTTLGQGEAVYYGGLDIDALARTLSQGAYVPPPTDRITPQP